MCLARGSVGGELIRGLGLGYTNPVGTEVVLAVGCGRGLIAGSGRIVWCYVCVSCEYGSFV